MRENSHCQLANLIQIENDVTLSCEILSYLCISYIVYVCCVWVYVTRIFTISIGCEITL